ncbi:MULTISPECIES: hypothetical protein [unclassified Kitasatospora]|uniref:hypothetical protein n=1 Tax=unclassified Kitasatospora TaxID=2633591 RepID=UPI0033E5B9D2
MEAEGSDETEGLAYGVRIVGVGDLGGAGVQGDEGDPVGDDVVHLPCQTGAFGVGSAFGVVLSGLFQQAVAFHKDTDSPGALVGGQAEGERHRTENERVLDDAGEGGERVRSERSNGISSRISARTASTATVQVVPRRAANP